MQYSTIGFIESLRAEKHRFVTRLIDSPTERTYGWLIEIGPLVLFKINGFKGEQLTVVKLFDKEWNW
jgi:hypothetical protein